MSHRMWERAFTLTRTVKTHAWVALVLLCINSSVRAASPPAVGADDTVGVRGEPKAVNRLVIDKPGTFDNYLIDAGGNRGNVVKIRSGNVILRHCDIGNSRGNGIFVSGSDVLIESCRIHHCIAGSAEFQEDAHGITGNPRNLMIRNCEIFYVSGDAVQFDPARKPWDNVTIENCTFWTGDLPAIALGYESGMRPGENAVDTKNADKNPRAKLTLRNCLFYGWNKKDAVNQAALNIKENVRVSIENCVFRDNNVCFRLRGSRRNAEVSVKDCAVYDSNVAFRIEDGIQGILIQRLALGEGIGELFTFAEASRDSFINLDQQAAPPFEESVRDGLVETTDHSPSQTPVAEATGQDESATDSVSSPPEENIVWYVRWRSYLPGGSYRTALAILLVVLMPVIGFTLYIKLSGQSKQFKRVIGDVVKRMFS